MTTENIVWADVESTGLRTKDGEVLLEVAFIVTDLNLNILDAEGFTSAVYYPEFMVEILKMKTSEYVRKMHTQTGLWDRLPTGIPLAQLDNQALDYIKQFNPESQTAWLGGNSISLDRDFLQEYLPSVYNHIHYRSLDVTSWAGPTQWWLGKQYQKKNTHNAFADIVESIEEMKFIRENIVK